MVDRDDLSEDVERQIDTAMNEADLILFVVDIRDELMPLDEEVAHRLRYVKTPVILVMNKADYPEIDDAGRRVLQARPRQADRRLHPAEPQQARPLLKLIDEMLPAGDDGKPAEAVMKIAVVGRPNTGKSTFINTLAQAERMIVSERPGTTRDSVDVRFELDGLPFLAIDTAGVKRKAKIRDNLDFYSIHRAERSIRRADVVLLFLDPTQGITRLDKQLADYIAKQYKPCIFVVNKWDLMVGDADDPSHGEHGPVRQRRPARLPHHELHAPGVHHGQDRQERQGAAEPGAVDVQAGRTGGSAPARSTGSSARPSTPTRRRCARTGPRGSTTPPRSAPRRRRSSCSSTRPSLFDATYQRYLLNVFREKLPFHDIPIKLYLRARKQTEPGARSRSGGGRREFEDEGDGIAAEDRRLAADEMADSGAESLRFLNREVNELLSDPRGLTGPRTGFRQWIRNSIPPGAQSQEESAVSRRLRSEAFLPVLPAPCDRERSRRRDESSSPKPDVPAALGWWAAS